MSAKNISSGVGRLTRISMETLPTGTISEDHRSDFLILLEWVLRHTGVSQIHRQSHTKRS